MMTNSDRKLSALQTGSTLSSITTSASDTTSSAIGNLNRSSLLEQIDPTALHMAYIAAQLQTLQEQNLINANLNGHGSSNNNKSLSDCMGNLANSVAIDNLYIAAATQLNSRTNVFLDIANQFSTVNGAHSTTNVNFQSTNDLPASFLYNAQQYAALEAMLQMQMAASAAAAAVSHGLLPQAMNFMSAGSIRNDVMTHPLTCLPNLTSFPLSNIPNSAFLPTELPTSNSFATSECNKDTLKSLYGVSTNHRGEIFSPAHYPIISGNADNINNDLRPQLETRSYSMGAREGLKRPSNHSKIFRKLCNEDEEDSFTLKKRFKKFSLDESTSFSSPSNGVFSSGVNTVSSSGMSSNLRNRECPNRHHPKNQETKPIDTRILECMAAMALHANFILPNAKSAETDKEETATTNADDTEKSIEEKNSATKLSVNSLETPVNEDNADNKDKSSMCEDQSESELVIDVDCKSTETKKKANETKDDLWLNSAVDEELCKTMATFAGSNVPVVNAYVLPSKSAEFDKDDSSSLYTVPLPVVDILLDRILKSMLIE